MEHPRICFGYKTALQLLRTIPASELSWARGKTATLPDRAPSKKELDATIAFLESSYPDLHIERPAHIVTGAISQCRSSKTCKPHMCSADLSGKSLYTMGNDIALTGPALTFTLIAAQEKEMFSLLELGYELCGSYQSGRTGAASVYQLDPLMSVQVLRDYTTRNSSLNGTKKVQQILRYLADGSASPRETKQALVLGMPLGYGGYGLGIPLMNYKITANKAARAISQKASFRADLCWPEAKLDVEYQSKEMHEGESSRIQDSRRTNALSAMGWTVVCITNDELDSLIATDTIAATIARHLGKRIRVRIPDYHARKLKLRRDLGLPLRHG